MKRKITSYLLILFSFFCNQFISAQGKYFKMESNLTTDDYMVNTIIFKVKPGVPFIMSGEIRQWT